MHEENCRQEIRVADKNTVTINRVLNVSSFDEDGILVKTECGNIVVEGEGLMARALCHEIDHLDGIVFLDRLER
jgi:peptide deformylase